MAEEKVKVEDGIEKPKVDDSIGKLKIKKKKFSKENNEPIKIDLSKPQEPISEEVEKQPIEEDVVVVNEEPKVEKEAVEGTKEEIKEEVEEKIEQETPIIQEVTDEDIEQIEEKIEEAVIETESTGKPLPENIQKLVDFMDETGGDISDYVNLNRDISKMDDSEVLDEYYRTTKSHLTPEERNFILEEKFSYDEEEDDPNDIKRKKIALKEQVAEAKAYLDGQKSKYYEEIKAGSKLTNEQQEAINFFNRYNKESEEQKKLSEASKKTFLKKTENVFNDKFKGFDYKVGDKKFRFNVKDVNKVKTTQSDINNFVNKFVGEDKKNIDDAAGYHKSLFTAMNADTIAKHFYEQGKADAIKETVAKDKNINMEPRKAHGETNVGGVKFKVLGQTSTDIKNRSFKVNKRK